MTGGRECRCCRAVRERLAGLPPAVLVVWAVVLVVGSAVASPVLGVVIVAYAVLAVVAVPGDPPPVLALSLSTTVCAVGYLMAGAVGAVAFPTTLAVVLVGAWRLAELGTRAVLIGGVGAPVERPRGGDDLPVPAFRDGALYVPEAWWAAHAGPHTNPADQLRALDGLGRMLPPPERQAFTRAMLHALDTGERIPVRPALMGGGS